MNKTEQTTLDTFGLQMNHTELQKLLFAIKFGTTVEGIQRLQQFYQRAYDHGITDARENEDIDYEPAYLDMD